MKVKARKLIYDEILAVANNYSNSDTILKILTTHIPKDLICYLKYLDFIMFSPDAILQNAHKEVIEKNGLHVLEYKFIVLNDKCVEKVYEKELVSGKINSWWIKRKIFSKGITFVAIIGREIPSGYKYLCDYILEVKGKSDPLEYEYGSVRYEYRVSSKAFGFMHSSDDIYSIVNEALVFFDMNQICNSLERIKMLIEKPYKLLYDSKALDINLKKQNIELSYYRVLYKIKKIIINKIRPRAIQNNLTY